MKVDSLNLHEYNIEEKKAAIIEIMGEQDLLIHPFYFKHEHHNVLRLCFDDVDTELTVKLLGNIKDSREYIPVIPMNEGQGKRIVEFVEANQDANVFIVHCAAGFSRSGAVAKFIDEAINEDSTVFNQNNKCIKPNQRILSILRMIYLAY